MVEATLNLELFLAALEKAGMNVKSLLDKVEAELAVKYPNADYIPIAQLQSIVRGALNADVIDGVVALVASELPGLFTTGKSKVKKRPTRWA